MKTYDIVKAEMRVIQPVFKEDQIRMLKDKRVTTLLNFLHTPKTFTEIKEFYLNIEYNSRSRNITEYLTKLIEAGLIIEVGRRVSRDNRKVVNIRKIFTRSACIFNIRTNKQPLSLDHDELLFLKLTIYKGKSKCQNFNLEKINEQLGEITQKRATIFDSLVVRSNDILSSQPKKNDWMRIYTLLDLTSWLVLFKNCRENLEMLFRLYD